MAWKRRSRPAACLEIFGSASSSGVSGRAGKNASTRPANAGDTLGVTHESPGPPRMDARAAPRYSALDAALCGAPGSREVATVWAWRAPFWNVPNTVAPKPQAFSCSSTYGGTHRVSAGTHFMPYVPQQQYSVEPDSGLRCGRMCWRRTAVWGGVLALSSRSRSIITSVLSPNTRATTGPRPGACGTACNGVTCGKKTGSKATQQRLV